MFIRAVCNSLPLRIPSSRSLPLLPSAATRLLLFHRQAHVCCALNSACADTMWRVSFSCLICFA